MGRWYFISKFYFRKSKPTYFKSFVLRDKGISGQCIPFLVLLNLLAVSGLSWRELLNDRLTESPTSSIWIDRIYSFQWKNSQVNSDHRGESRGLLFRSEYFFIFKHWTFPTTNLCQFYDIDLVSTNFHIIYKLFRGATLSHPKWRCIFR